MQYLAIFGHSVTCLDRLMASIFFFLLFLVFHRLLIKNSDHVLCLASVFYDQIRSRSYDVIRGTASGNFTKKSVFYRTLT